MNEAKKKHIRIIKACSGNVYYGEIPHELILRSNIMSREIALILDLNILNIMKDCLDYPELMYLYPNLQDFIRFLNSSPNVVLVPSFALGEARQDYAMEVYYAYELFIRFYCPNYINAHNGINKFAFKKHESKFSQLDKELQFPISLFYACSLCMLICKLQYSNDKLMEQGHIIGFLMIKLEYACGVLPAYVIEVAKIVFFKGDSNEWAHSDFLTQIKKNFGKSGGDILHAALNIAFDLFLIFISSAGDKRLLDGIPQDLWLVTADNGIAEFSKFLNYTDDKGSFELKRDDFMKNSEYWQTCDNLHLGFRQFFPQQIKANELDYDKLFEKIKELETELQGLKHDK